MLNEMKKEISTLLDNMNEASSETIASAMYKIAVSNCLEIIDKYISIYGDDGR